MNINPDGLRYPRAHPEAIRRHRRARALKWTAVVLMVAALALQVAKCA